MIHLLTTWFHAASLRERRIALWSIVTLLAGIVWGGTVFVRTRTMPVPTEGGTLRIGATGQPRFVLPILAQTNDVDMDLARLLYNGLLTVTPEGTLTGDLAESVEVVDEGKTYRAKLRKNVRWHDGEPFTAEDVLATVRLIQDPALKSPIATKFQGVEVTKEDDHTVRFQLKEPYAPFLYTLQTGILPAHIWSQIPPQSVVLSEHVLRPVGTGPFAFKKFKKAEFSGEIREYRLERNPQYYGRAPYLAAILFRFFPTSDDLLRALRRGEVNSATFIPPSAVADVARLRSVRIERVRLPQYFAVFINQAKNVALSDPAVRRALLASVERSALIRDALRGEGVHVTAPIPPGSLGYSADLGSAESTLDQVKQNLEEAGWKDTDSDGLREKGEVKLQFTITTTDWPEYVNTAKLLAEQWRALGANITVQPSPVGTLQADILRPRNYEALLYGEVLGADPDPYPFWHSTQTRDPGLNLALFKDPAADKLLEDARRTTNIAQRGAIYRTFQERVLEEVPAIFLYSPTYAYGLPREMRGAFLTDASLPADRFATASTWYLKTKRVWKRD